jgi:hypothetical protein
MNCRHAELGPPLQQQLLLQGQQLLLLSPLLMLWHSLAQSGCQVVAAATGGACAARMLPGRCLHQRHQTSTAVAHAQAQPTASPA